MTCLETRVGVPIWDQQSNAWIWLGTRACVIGDAQEFIYARMKIEYASLWFK